MLRSVLFVHPPRETERLLRESGIPVPVRFFQAFMIHAWYGRRLSAGLDPHPVG
jgi:tRNA (cmo5U34)-methyltransferase